MQVEQQGSTGGGGRGGGPQKVEKNNFLMFLGRFGGRDLFHRVGHQFSDLFGGILTSGDGLGVDLRGFLIDQ